MVHKKVHFMKKKKEEKRIEFCKTGRSSSHSKLQPEICLEKLDSLHTHREIWLRIHGLHGRGGGGWGGTYSPLYHIWYKVGAQKVFTAQINHDRNLKPAAVTGFLGCTVAAGTYCDWWQITWCVRWRAFQSSDGLSPICYSVQAPEGNVSQLLSACESN